MGSGSPNYGSWNAFGFRSSSAESEDIAVVILETARLFDHWSGRAMSAPHPTVFNKATSMSFFHDWDS